MKDRKHILKQITLSLIMAGALSCQTDESFKAGEYSTEPVKTAARLPSKETRNVLLYVCAGYNSLSQYLTEDLKDLTAGYLPQRKTRKDHILLVLSRLPKNGYSKTESPVLFRMYAKDNGTPIRDTLLKWEKDTPISSAQTLNEALVYIEENFPAKGYGMVFSSHASGWIPKHRQQTRSIGQDVDDSQYSEIDLDEFAEAIPYRMDYILLDACLSGCVEVAWQLREKTDIIGFSPTEILAEGFNYKTLTTHLLKDEPDPVTVCKEYFEQYNAEKGAATITVVDTKAMDPLAEQCAILFEKYRTELKSLPTSEVQRYFRPTATPDFVYLFDLIDMTRKAGMDKEEERRLLNAYEQCVVYTAKTPQFLSIPLNNANGLSMYLPSSGNEQIDNYYKEHIQWNKATKLIK